MIQKQINGFWHQSNLILSQLLLTRFWSKFKVRFLGSYWTNSNCQNDNCPGNVWPGDICSYQEYISCYWPNFDQTLGFWDHLEQIPTVTVTFVNILSKRKLPNKIWPNKNFAKKIIRNSMTTYVQEYGHFDVFTKNGQTADQ